MQQTRCRSQAAELTRPAPDLSRAAERLILALDFPSSLACFDFLGRLQERLSKETRVRWLKIGLELFLAEGPSLVRELHALGYRIFLDLKLHDIPNTVAGAIRSVLPLEPALLTVHASGGPAMLAVAAGVAEGSATRLLAVTVLTSMDTTQLSACGVVADPAAQVLTLARMAAAHGIPGLVCSAQEAATLRVQLPGAYLVTPGIRPAGADRGDQQRVTSPAAAIAAGANQLVLGRPITAAADPAAAWLGILGESAAAL